MERKPQRGDPLREKDGVRIVYDERTGLGGALLLVVIVVSSALTVFFLLRGANSPVRDFVPSERVASLGEPLPKQAVVRGGAAVQTERRLALPRRRNVAGSQPKSDDLRTSDESENRGDAREGPRPDLEAGDFIAALRESGETGGLAAFSPPGTNPPRSGVIVPSDYELPEGFARHYQATDDGRQLQPILIVAPGYEIVDDAGELVTLTDDRIVPPEYAPPDLPVQMLDVPSEHGPGEDGH